MRSIILLCAALLAVAGGAAQADYYLHNTIDLSGAFGPDSTLGTHPISVAYDGVSAFVGGYIDSSSLSTGFIGVARVDGLGTGDNATFNSLAGTVLGANALEGYNSVVLGPAGGSTWLFAGKDNANGGGNIISSVDPVSGNPNGSFGTAGVLTNPGGRTRMHGGIGFDPGFGGAGSGVSHLESGQGRRQLVDAITGAEIYGVSGDPAPGFVIFNAAIGSVYRGHAYDPATGDLYVRVKNNVQKSVRTGANAANASAVIVDLTDADAVIGQNIEFISGGPGSAGAQLIILNDRSQNAAPQPFLSQVLLATAAGGAAGVQLLDGLGNPLALPDGNGLYDFAYSGLNDSLVIVDYYNKSLYVFANQVVPEPGSLIALAGGLLSGIAILRRRA